MRHIAHQPIANAPCEPEARLNGARVLKAHPAPNDGTKQAVSFGTFDPGGPAKKGSPMFLETVDQFAGVAAAKAAFLKRSPLGFWISAMMAGAYIGLGIILIFSVGNSLDAGIRPVVMGASFGLALTLVVFAGSDLFNAHTMFMTFGWLRGRTGMCDVLACWCGSWAGNLAGSFLLAALFVAGGGGMALTGKAPLILSVAAAKMNAPALELVARAALCNWLACLAVWTSARMTSDAAKCIVIFGCVYAFFASGFEHSVANMTLLSIALLAPHPATVSLGGFGWNLLWVTLGNVLSGAGIMGLGYFTASREPVARAPRVRARWRPRAEAQPAAAD
jgi:nitrite transporter